jgi:peroxiredoxin
MKSFALINQVAALLAGLAGFSLQGASLKVGEPFPVIALPAAKDDQPMSVNDFRGRKLLLHLFSSW